MKFLITRTLWSMATLLVVFTITFLLMRFVPGGPFASERKLPEAIQRNFEERYHVNDPLYEQYFVHLGRMLRGDFGMSFRVVDFSVNEIIYQGLPISASLGILAITLALLLGVTAGVISAARRGTAIDAGVMGIAALGVAVPSFVVATLAIVVFVFWLRWLPAGGWGTLKQLILPSLCLAAPLSAYIARLTRAGMLEVLNLDYIRTAYAKGLSEWRVITTHALRGAFMPVLAYLGPATAYVLTGSPIVEKIFNIPGLGSHFVEAALQRDFTLSQGLVMVFTLLLLVMNAIVDYVRTIIDPRIKLE